MRTIPVLLVALALIAVACDERTPLTNLDGAARDLAASDAANEAGHPDSQRSDLPEPLSGDKIDLLFVIDNSGSMELKQRGLAASFLGLIEALRDPKYGGEGCSAQAVDQCNIPDLHLGVVSTDLGAGSYSHNSCEIEGGDKGELQNTAKVAGCTPPSDPWISFKEGVTNIPGGSGDPVQDVKDAFSCIAKLGTSGCNFESQIESARRALDPSVTVNPGFIRPDAMLAVVFITDEDDCSAAKPQLFDPDDVALGPISSFRCTLGGLLCDEPLNGAGVKTDCEPGMDWLFSVDDYANFFAQLKPPGGLILAAIAGPPEPVKVIENDDQLKLQWSCLNSTSGFGVPAIRIRALMEHPALKQAGHQGFFNPAGVTICSPEFTPAMTLLGEAIAEKLGG